VQVATATTVLLFVSLCSFPPHDNHLDAFLALQRLNKLGWAVPTSLADLLADDGILKVGVGIDRDASELKT
jgi:hypothetical protein